MATPGDKPLTYTTNERVLCYHGPLIYEAKVLKTDNFTETTTVTGFQGPHYFVHYKGWKQTWDEWVPASRLLKFNETNVALQKSLSASKESSSHASKGGSKSHSQHLSAGFASMPGAGGGSAAGLGGVGGAGSGKEAVSTRGARGKDSAAGAASRKDGARGTKRAREDDEKGKIPEMKLDLPEILKVMLVDDWESVTKNNQLVTLPRNPNVSTLLSEFAEYIKEKKPATVKEPSLLALTVVKGLQCYFDRALGTNLLYRFERPQYAQIRKEYFTGPNVVYGVTEKEMSYIYGAEHLLRMLVSLPQIITHTTLDGESVSLLKDYVNELFQWMVQEKDRIFQKQYDHTDLSYQNVSRS
ncbi:hypothetical protein CVT24_012199 [Panaeolus cyanescens]|uniref:Chromatin modification-related protein EAF3 n=1 Tax=Panaeolus cyanescens TaxID=181874 RepID=A0A409YIW5_9AGAR|nr:hypothetical protein CVT24_012199 [Panaeolus cyanescens]